MDSTPWFHRTLANLNSYGHWQYFKMNDDGTYFKDANGKYVYKPVWIDDNKRKPEDSELTQSAKRKKVSESNGE